MADRRLQVFHAVGKHLSFTRAAETLFMSQPAVTFQVRQLEDQFRTRLIERRHGGIVLTPAGERVMDYAGRILALSDELDARIAEMTEELRGPLNIGASTTVAAAMAPGLLAAFNAAHPQARLNLTVANSAAIAEAVAAHRLDLGLVDGPPVVAALDAQRCCTEELVVACTRDHPLCATRKLKPAVLTEFEYLSREPGSGSRAAIEAYFAAQGVAPAALKTQMELGSPAALLGIVASGLGFAIVARTGVEAGAANLAALPLTPPLFTDITLIAPPDRYETRLAGIFRQFARERLGDFVP